MDRGKRLLALVALSLCLGCVLIDRMFPTGERPFAFSHDLHVREEGLVCTSCHETLGVSDDPGMPAPDGCDVCHVDIDEGRPPERQVASLFGADAAFQAARASALDEEVVFGHLVHVRAVGDCDACHRGIEENEGIDGAVAVAMEDCVACHAERSAPDDCATCHTVIDRGWEPDTHLLDWKRRHGKACRRADPDPIDSCRLCHQQSSCDECHLIEQPESHDAHFRLRGHGVVARFERQSCAACHEPYSCDRCHETMLPTSHAGAWGSARNTHCLTCHFPLRATGCATCHEDTPSHSVVPPQPAWHRPSLACRQCHFAPPNLKHVDDGTNCNLCHG